MANSSPKKSKKTKIGKFKIDTSWKNLVLYATLILIAGFLFLGATQTTTETASAVVPLSQIIKDVKSGKVSEITITDNKLNVKEGDKTVQAFKEPGSNIVPVSSR